MSRQFRVVLDSPPIAIPLKLEEEAGFAWESLNRHEKLRRLVRMDAELSAAVHALADIVTESIKGFVVKFGEELSAEEEALQTVLDELWKSLKRYIYDIAYKLVVYGDAVYLVDIREGVGFRGMQYLPIQHLTILDKRPPKTDDSLIQEANYYVLNEMSGEKQQIFTRDEVIHFSLGKLELKLDHFNRKTLGIWNTSIIEPLLPIVMYKRAIMINDMRWRSVSVPREHHILKSAAFDPDMFPGDTHEDRVKAAEQAAKEFLQKYASELQRTKADKAYITFDSVEIEVVEPKLKYTSPNELLEQLDDIIRRTVGIPGSVVGKPSGTYAGEIVCSAYFQTRVRHLAERIAVGLMDIAERHVRAAHGKRFDEHWHKVDVRIYTELFLREQARAAAILAATNSFTRNEIRAILGFPPLPSEEGTQLAEGSQRYLRSPNQLLPSDIRTVGPSSRPRPEHSTKEVQIT